MCFNKCFHVRRRFGTFAIHCYNTDEDRIIWVEYGQSFISKERYSLIHLYIAGNNIKYVDFGHSDVYDKMEMKENGKNFLLNENQGYLLT